MKRREALKLSGIGLGFTLSGATLMSVISSCKQDLLKELNLQVLNQAEFDILNELSETILPKSDTPGAKDARVAEFIDLFISKIYPEELQIDFKSGLAELNQQCIHLTGKDISSCSSEERIQFISSIEEDNYIAPVSIWGNTVEEGSELPFYKQIKQMSMWGYFSSEIVGKEVLLYQVLAPGYQGCVDLMDEMRIPSV